MQIIDSYNLQMKAFDEWTRDLPIMAKRGDIYDRNGECIASSMTNYVLYVRPNALREHERVARVISDVLGLNYDATLSKVKKRGVSEVRIASDVSHDEMSAIEQEHMSGVYFATGNKRVYKYGDFMSSLLGFTNIDNIGQTGIEQFYDNYLCGVDGKILHETDLIGNEINGGKMHFLPSIDGGDVYLTIDRHIQGFAESAVHDAIAKYNAKNASCIIMNVNNGDIYAYAKAPSFDLNNIPRDNLDALFAMSKVDMVSSVYEPGSTFKILTAAIGLEEHAYPESHRFYCPGYRMIDNQRIRCWRTIGHGSQTFGEGIENSCNCVFMDVATRVGTHKMYEYFDKFGLTRKTGIDVKGETSGLLLKEENVKNVDIARIGFGQAIAVTPIRLLSSVCAVINGGKRVTPSVVKEIHSRDKVIPREEKNGDRIISNETSIKMREYLERVVSHGGGKNAHVDGYRIGGKTGTAQKYVDGAIASGKYISSFVGFAPADNPEYALLMIVDEPEGYQYYGSLVAAPYAHDIFSNIFAYENMPPVIEESIEEIIMPDIRGMNLLDASLTLKAQGLSYESLGDNGTVSYQFPAPGAKIDKTTVVFMKLGED